MRPTRRGWVLIATVLLAIASAAAFGPRGLNAIAAPGAVALVAAAWQVYRFEPPTVERELPAHGERGSTVPVRLHLETPTERSARVVESIGDGLAAPEARREVLLGETTVSYDLDLESRGERSVGPLTISVYDVLGLVQRTIRDRGTASILVRPRVRRLGGPGTDALAWLHGGVSDDRHAFDGLRRYHRGDPLRDIHWKSSAKRADGEFVVKRFAVEEDARTVEIAASAAPGTADEMAEAAASVGVGLVEAGVRVGLTTPDGRVTSDEQGGREAILDHLALVGDGRSAGPPRGEADVSIEATPSGVEIEIAGRAVPFADVVGDRRATTDSPAEVTT